MIKKYASDLTYHFQHYLKKSRKNYYILRLFLTVSPAASVDSATLDSWYMGLVIAAFGLEIYTSPVEPIIYIQKSFLLRTALTFI